MCIFVSLSGERYEYRIEYAVLTKELGDLLNAVTLSTWTLTEATVLSTRIASAFLVLEIG